MYLEWRFGLSNGISCRQLVMVETDLPNHSSCLLVTMSNDIDLVMSERQGAVQLVIAGLQFLARHFEGRLDKALVDSAVLATARLFLVNDASG